MTEFSENTHGIQVMYTDGGQMTVEMCNHVGHERAIVLLCTAIHAVAVRDGVSTEALLEVIETMLPLVATKIKKDLN